MSVEGPYNVTGVGNSPSRQKLYVCTPASPADELACAQQIISTLARRAYRRPVTADDLAAPMAFYNDARATGDFDAGIRAGAARVLASPNFIYRVELLPHGTFSNMVEDVRDVLPSGVEFLGFVAPGDVASGTTTSGSSYAIPGSNITASVFTDGFMVAWCSSPAGIQAACWGGSR